MPEPRQPPPAVLPCLATDHLHTYLHPIPTPSFSGNQIAKPKGEEGRGGWAHALCIVAKAKGEGGSKGEKAVGGEAAEESEEAETEKPDSSKRKRGSGGGKAAAAAASGGRGRRQRRRVSEE